MIPIAWKIWYNNGSEYDSTKYAWASLPVSGVEFVMVYYKEEWAPGSHYRDVLMGGDIFNLGSWFVNFDLPVYNKQGLMMDDKDFATLQEKVWLDHGGDWLPKQKAEVVASGN